MGAWDGERFEVEDSLFGFIQFADGSSLHIRTAFAVNIPGREERSVRLYGDRKGLDVFPLKLYGDEDGRPYNVSYPFDEDGDWHYDCVRNFVDSCMGKAQVLVKPEQAVYVQKLIEGLYRSAETNQPTVYR